MPGQVAGRPARPECDHDRAERGRGPGRGTVLRRVVERNPGHARRAGRGPGRPHAAAWHAVPADLYGGQRAERVSEPAAAVSAAAAVPAPAPVPAAAAVADPAAAVPDPAAAVPEPAAAVPGGAGWRRPAAPRGAHR